MERDEKLEKIKEMLKDEYGDSMSDEDINAFAKDLHFSVFECEFGLDDIFGIVDQYESDAGIESNRWYYIFCGMIELLDNNEETAELLYETFMYHWDILEIFIKLYFENDEYISAEKLEKATKKALNTFDKELLAGYGITE